MSRMLNLKLWGDAVRGGMLPFAILALVVLMIVPVPTFVLDVGFIANIMLSIAVLMIALNAAKPLDFSAFPTVLLLATLFRLALNVASTRVVLVDGHTGADAAGHVIEAFGAFLIGGDYIVGLLVFAVLMIIQIQVIQDLAITRAAVARAGELTLTQLELSFRSIHAVEQLEGTRHRSRYIAWLER